MITEHDLQEAIAECQGKRNPDANTCVKLAAFYTIKEHLFPKNTGSTPVEPQYSFASPPGADESIKYSGESEFAQAITGRNINDILPILDEAMSALSVLNPRLYASIIRKIEY